MGSPKEQAEEELLGHLKAAMVRAEMRKNPQMLQEVAQARAAIEIVKSENNYFAPDGGVNKTTVMQSLEQYLAEETGVAVLVKKKTAPMRSRETIMEELLKAEAQRFDDVMQLAKDLNLKETPTEGSKPLTKKDYLDTLKTALANASPEQLEAVLAETKQEMRTFALNKERLDTKGGTGAFAITARVSLLQEARAAMKVIKQLGLELGPVEPFRQSLPKSKGSGAIATPGDNPPPN